MIQIAEMIFLNSGTGNRELTIQFFYVIGINALSTDSTVVCFQYDIVGHLSVNVEMPAAGSDSPCLAVEEVWRTSPTFLFWNKRFIVLPG